MGRFFAMAIVSTALAISTRADEILYQYEGDVLPYDQSAGWIIADPCEQPNCTEYLRDGYPALEWLTGNLANYDYTLADPPDDPPPTPFWIEWRFRSDDPKPPPNLPAMPGLVSGIGRRATRCTCMATPLNRLKEVTCS